jgi:hypothetical protein
MRRMAESPERRAELPGRPPAARSASRLRAGVASDLGLVPKDAADRWRGKVLAGEFDPDACADELLSRPLSATEEGHVLERSGTLLRDLLMAPLQRGAQGRARAARGAAKRTSAMAVAHLFAFAVYGLLAIGALAVMRARGASIDGLVDNLLSWFRIG